MLTPISISALERFLRWNKSLAAEAEAIDEGTPQVVIIGASRFGHLVAQSFIGLNQRVLVVDHKAEIVEDAVKYPQIPAIKVMAGAFDGDHGLLPLARAGVDHHIQELDESPLSFGELAMHEFGLDVDTPEKF
ncbi:hypothetical protein M2360_004899 [Rhizobium sp. SG_E_25_P2]|uniref:hypothetical protein n=1 Tax=Rhizobium sp. SG_E_25_P2 TaxID=2879942 RepID=UPI002474F3D4|nr:hypothetical protein [Rhizobium sp. SG_E_25_P2]MDH6269471.1 hypothetical protein [Rhizobium sp. SG_E_25_P2]